MEKGDVIVDVCENLRFYKILKADPDEHGFVECVGITVTKDGALYSCDTSSHIDINEHQDDETRYMLAMADKVLA